LLSKDLSRYFYLVASGENSVDLLLGELLRGDAIPPLFYGEEFPHSL
jgi:hypothetical protein